MNHLTWGILGLELIADEFADHLEKNGITYYIASESGLALFPFLNRHPGAVPCANISEMLANPAIDIIYVSTLGDRHYRCIRECLEHGKHVFCEKTMLGNYEQFLELKEIAGKKQLFLGEANTVFYMPLFQKIRSMIGEGAIGTKKIIRADFGSLKVPSPGNPLFSSDKKGGAMLDIGIYALSFAGYFMTVFPEEEVHLSFGHPSGVDEAWNIVLKNGLGELADINLQFCAKLPKRAIIAGDRAYFLIDGFNRADTASLVYPDGREEQVCAGDSRDAVSYEIRAAEEAVASRDYRTSCLDITEKVVRLMDRLLQSRPVAKSNTPAQVFGASNLQ